MADYYADFPHFSSPCLLSNGDIIVAQRGSKPCASEKHSEFGHPGTIVNARLQVIIQDHVVTVGNYLGIELPRHRQHVTLFFTLLNTFKTNVTKYRNNSYRRWRKSPTKNGGKRREPPTHKAIMIMAPGSKNHPENNGKPQLSRCQKLQ